MVCIKRNICYVFFDKLLSDGNWCIFLGISLDPLASNALLMPLWVCTVISHVNLAQRF